MTLWQLSEAWNALRNAALGRGTKPHVSAELAKQVGAEYDAWRAYYATLGVSADLIASVTSAEWVDRLHVLDRAVRAEGITGFVSLPTTATEEFFSIVKTTGLVVLAVGLPLGLLLLFGRRR